MKLQLSQKSRKGFATLTSIILLGIMSIAVTTLAATFSAEIRRTRGMATDAQLRQLLLAGAADVAVHARTWTKQPPAAGWQVALPSELSQENSSLMVNVKINEAGETDAEVIASYLGQKKVQALRLTFDGSRWDVKSVE